MRPLRVLGLLGLFVAAAGGYWLLVMRRARAPMVFANQANPATPSMPRSSEPAVAGVLFTVVDELVRNRPFTPDGVSRITGAPVREPSRSSRQYFLQPARAPVQAVELWIPRAAASAKDGRVILSISAEARIEPEAVMRRFGASPEVSVPEPAAPFEFTYGYQRPWGKLSFQFARGTRFLQWVIIDATEVQPSASIGMAAMSEDGTITLDLRAEGPGGVIGDARLVYPRGHKQYEEILRHLGGLRPGETKPVPPWPERKE